MDPEAPGGVGSRRGARPEEGGRGRPRKWPVGATTPGSQQHTSGCGSLKSETLIPNFNALTGMWSHYIHETERLGTHCTATKLHFAPRSL